MIMWSACKRHFRFYEALTKFMCNFFFFLHLLKLTDASQYALTLKNSFVNSFNNGPCMTRKKSTSSCQHFWHNSEMFTILFRFLKPFSQQCNGISVFEIPSKLQPIVVYFSYIKNRETVSYSLVLTLLHIYNGVPWKQTSLAILHVTYLLKHGIGFVIARISIMAKASQQAVLEWSLFVLYFS